MSRSFPELRNMLKLWGGPLDPPIANEISFIRAKPADEGVGCGPEGPPHHQFGLLGSGKLSGIGLKAWPHASR